jgi:hypothetical protein
MSKIKLLFYGLIALVVISIGITGCGKTSDAANATPTPNNNTIGSGISNILDAQATKALWTPTPENDTIIDAGATALWVEVHVGMTQQAAANALQFAGATQTAVALNQQATQRAADAATSEAWKQTYWNATQTMAPIQTATAYPPIATAYSQTQTAIPLYATDEAVRVYANQTVVVGAAYKVAVEAQRARWSGTANQFVFYGVILAILIFVGAYLKRNAPFKKLTPTVWSVKNEKTKQEHVVDTTLLPAPITIVGPDGAKPTGMINEENQAKVTEREQKIRAVRSLPPMTGQTPQRALGMTNALMGSGRSGVNINILTGGQTDPLLEDFEEQLNQ